MSKNKLVTEQENVSGSLEQACADIFINIFRCQLLIEECRANVEDN